MENDEYLKAQLHDCLLVINTCLAAIYKGEEHMYRALAGQLRILWCDNNIKHKTILRKLHPEIKIKKIQKIEWSPNQSGPIVMMQPKEGTLKIGQMPFEITKYSNNTVIADFLHVETEEFLDQNHWLNQYLYFTPTPITIRDVVKFVSDQGGGSHIDKKPDHILRLLYQRTPTGHTFAEMFIIALSRLTQNLSEQIIGFESCRIESEIQSDKHVKYYLHMAVHADLAEAIRFKQINEG